MFWFPWLSCGANWRCMYALLFSIFNLIFESCYRKWSKCWKNYLSGLALRTTPTYQPYCPLSALSDWQRRISIIVYDQKCYRMVIVSIIYHLIDVIYWRSYAMSAHHFDWSFEKARKKNVIFHHRLGESYRNLAKVRTTWLSVTWFK